MKKRNGLLLVAIGALVATAWSPAGANDVMTWRVDFLDPYFITKFEKDCVIVVNHDMDHELTATGISYDAFSGEVLDRKVIRVPPGRGDKMTFTDTIPETHASFLVLQVTMPTNDIPGAEPAFAEFADDIAFTATRLLVKARNHETLLQVPGVPQLMDANGSE